MQAKARMHTEESTNTTSVRPVHGKGARITGGKVSNSLHDTVRRRMRTHDLKAVRATNTHVTHKITLTSTYEFQQFLQYLLVT